MQDSIYISGLESLITPEKVAAWPPAPAFFVLTGFLLLALLLFLLSRIRNGRKNRYRLLAMDQLHEIELRAGKQAGTGDMQALNRLLKETALTVYPREQVASLYGKEWMEFLDSHCSRTRFSEDRGTLLEAAANQKNKEVDIPADQWDQLIAEVDTWIRKHTYSYKTK